MILSEIALRQLEELAEILRQLTVAEYTTGLTLLDQASLGKHVRHTLEFHHCFLDRKSSFSYDDRPRELRLEQSPDEAVKQIQTVINRLRFVQLDQVLQLRVQYGSAEVTVTSSVQRELAFLIEHTVHHLAILRMALTTHYPNVKMDATFGYADSTIRYLQHRKTAV